MLVTIGVGCLCLMLGLVIGYEAAYWSRRERMMTTEQMLNAIDTTSNVVDIGVSEEDRDGWH